MIDLYEIRDGQQIRVASASMQDICDIGIRTFFRVQELTGRKIVYAREENHEQISE